LAVQSIKANTGMNVRNGHSTTAKRIGGLQKGQSANVVGSYQASDFMWYNIKWGTTTAWIASGSGAGGAWLTITQSNNVIARTDPAAKAKPPSTDLAEVASDLGGIPGSVSATTQSIIAELKKGLTKASLYNKDGVMEIKQMHNIIGMPFQFIDSTDPRLIGMEYGRMFTENIIMNMPIATINAGVPQFMGSAGSDSKAAMLTALASNVIDDVGGKITDLLKEGNSRYYWFKSQSADYFAYVNMLCRLSAEYMGLGDLEVDGSGGGHYWDYNWGTASNSNNSFLNTLCGLNSSIYVYYQPHSSITESMSNSTDQSMMANIFGSASEKAKEASFILGTTTGGLPKFMDPAASQQNLEGIAKMAGNNDNNFFKRIFGKSREAITLTAQGANMLFPEIWKNANFSRSYQLEVKLSSPYGDPESVYRHVLVPLWHLMCLGFPKQAGANGFAAPFICQIFSKGMFNAELAIMESMSITRGGDGDNVSIKDIPLEITVNLTFKDLFDSMSITPTGNWGLIANNIGLIDYMATLSGVTVDMPDFKRMLTVMMHTQANKVLDIPGNIKARISDAMRDVVMREMYDFKSNAAAYGVTRLAGLRDGTVK
jgi:hypothetical protein